MGTFVDDRATDRWGVDTQTSATGDATATKAAVADKKHVILAAGGGGWGVRSYLGGDGCGSGAGGSYGSRDGRGGCRLRRPRYGRG